MTDSSFQPYSSTYIMPLMTLHFSDRKRNREANMFPLFPHIGQGDECSNLFFTKAKQRKLAPYIFTLKVDNGSLVKGFDAVGQTMWLYKPFTDHDIKAALFSIPNHKSPGPLQKWIFQTYLEHDRPYGALHAFHTTVGLRASLHKSQIVIGRASLELHTTCLQITELQDSQLPLKYLGVPISDGKLSNIHYSSLLEKITARIHIWATRNLLFAGRARLINSASIFLLPNAAFERLTQLYRNYRWSGLAEFKRVPHISWTITCQPKSFTPNWTQFVNFANQRNRVHNTFSSTVLIQCQFGIHHIVGGLCLLPKMISLVFLTLRSSSRQHKPKGALHMLCLQQGYILFGNPETNPSSNSKNYHLRI
ncbi:hypothetical protein Cgig2_025551 [Carnegiea gigantea]|uniref:Uncharacterized protein n=1 Tax=Carnegiea gigantea TaxID=171969 RepID=A0A9Q1GM29_9CARY|nr:hypothetical protein Cgig2_025551 [Carnegiea gigantea]